MAIKCKASDFIAEINSNRILFETFGQSYGIEEFDPDYYDGWDYELKLQELAFVDDDYRTDSCDDMSMVQPRHRHLIDRYFYGVPKKLSKTVKIADEQAELQELFDDTSATIRGIVCNARNAWLEQFKNELLANEIFEVSLDVTLADVVRAFDLDTKVAVLTELYDTISCCNKVNYLAHKAYYGVANIDFWSTYEQNIGYEMWNSDLARQDKAHEAESALRYSLCSDCESRICPNKIDYIWSKRCKYGYVYKDIVVVELLSSNRYNADEEFPF